MTDMRQLIRLAQDNNVLLQLDRAVFVLDVKTPIVMQSEYVSNVLNSILLTSNEPVQVLSEVTTEHKRRSPFQNVIDRMDWQMDCRPQCKSAKQFLEIVYAHNLLSK